SLIKKTQLSRPCLCLYIKLLLLHSFQHEVLYPNLIIRHGGDIIELEPEVLRREFEREIIDQKVQSFPDHHNGYELARTSVAEIITAAALRHKVEWRLLPSVKAFGHEHLRVHPIIRVSVLTI